MTKSKSVTLTFEKTTHVHDLLLLYDLMYDYTDDQLTEQVGVVHYCLDTLASYARAAHQNELEGIDCSWFHQPDGLMRWQSIVSAMKAYAKEIEAVCVLFEGKFASSK